MVIVQKYGYIYTDFRLYFEGNIVTSCSLKPLSLLEFAIKINFLLGQLQNSYYQVFSAQYSSIIKYSVFRMGRHQLLRI